MRKLILIFSLVTFALHLVTGCEYRKFSSTLSANKNNTNITIDVTYQYRNGLTIHVNRSGVPIQTIFTSDDLDSSVETTTTTNSLTMSGYTRSVTITLEVDTVNYTEFSISRQLTRGVIARDCLDLASNVYWYGGPEMKNSQLWPIESQNFTEEAYVTKEFESMAITERYWLNSKGVYFYVKPEAPLFITQTPKSQLCFIAKKEKPYNTEARYFTFEYRIGVAKDPKEAHLKAVERYLGKPSGLPDKLMVQRPIWSTWAKYKADINETIVKSFANDIITNGFTNSQLEIDDLWEQCYGSLTINMTRFPNMTALTEQLRKDGFRVTLWIHPFINEGCEPWYSEAKDKGYFVKNSTGHIRTKWWNTVKADEWASYIDFTNQEAAQWFVDRLKKLKAAGGFDGFKFDAGETSWAPADPILQGNKELHPGKLTTDYINTVKQFGNITEVRSGQNNQNMDIFVRMIDKDTYWGYNNGLVTLVTTLLQMNMNGYPFVLPDMIGGNGYNSVVTRELFIRWLQANVFMPALQYSYVPW